MAAVCNKLLLSLGNEPILSHTLRLFQQHPRIAHIFLVVADQDRSFLETHMNLSEPIRLITGGAERQDSVFNALQALQEHPPAPKWVLVHDGARPLCPTGVVDRVLDQCEKTGAAIPVMPLTDTIRQITPQSTTVLDRSQLFATQTPQGFDTDLLSRAYQMAYKHGWKTTDDASVVERYGHSVATIEGASENLKITTPIDLELAKWHLQQKASSQNFSESS